ncbi:MAG: glycoside hydrolase family 3 N-terminal domain-containing protein [Gemmatimonadales bacterium]|jgi:beta-N-acetylhexosaminidase
MHRSHLRLPLPLLASLLAACAHVPPAPSLGPLDVPVPEVAEIEAPPLPAAAVREAPPLSSLSIREKAAQLVMPWIGGEYWASDNAAMEAALQLARDQGVGGFVVGVGTSPYDLAAKLNALQRAARLPLLVAADLESGPAMRFRGGTAFPGNMALGATGRELDAYEVGRVTAVEARAVGIHWVFAPVVDVNNDPANPIINTRSFGEDPQRVGELGAAFLRGVEEHGLMATAKHFPGHGDTGVDSHLALPLISADRARLDTVELVPFRAAVRAGVDAVMSGHLAVPALTGPGGPPATLSAAVLDTLLRGQLGFRGLVVTDALNMGAIVSRYGAAQAAVRAFEAGADVLLMPGDAASAIDALAAAVESGEIPMARLDASVARIFAAKTRAGLWARRQVDLRALAGSVGSTADWTLAQDIARRSVVLVRDSLRLVPLPPERRRRVVVAAYGDDGGSSVGATLIQTLRAGVDTLRAFRLYPASGPASYDSVRSAATGAGAVIVAAAPRPAAWRPDAVSVPAALAALVEELSLAGHPVILVSLGSPYVLAQVPHVPAFLVAWNSTDPTERAAAQALLGLAPIGGRLPVSLPPLYPLGSGLERGAPPAAPAPTPP